MSISLVSVVIIVILLVLFVIRLYDKNTNAVCKSTKRLDGRTAIVTGGTAGMGLEISRDFAARGARVIIACPFLEEGLNAEKTIKHDTGSTNVVFKLLNLASLESVRKFSEEILKAEDRLDILVNNAGIAKRDRNTADGISLVMQVNYFGHFLLTLLLLPLLKRTGKPSEPSRVVNTSSVAHSLAIFGLDDVKKPAEYMKWIPVFIYGNSKFCFVLFSQELTRKLKGSNVVVNSIDPGVVGTRFFDGVVGVFGGFVAFIFCFFCKTPWEGAQTALHVSLDPRAADVSGENFKNCKLTRAVPWAYNEETAKKVWDKSVTIVKLTDDEMKKCLTSP